MRAEPARRLRSKLIACLVAAACAALALPGAVLAQGSPFGPLPPAQTATAPTTPATTSSTSTTSGSSSVGSTTIYLAVLGAIVVIAAIGWFIARDARRVAPVPERAPGSTGGRRDIEKERARARARAKAARAQRRKNR